MASANSRPPHTVYTIYQWYSIVFNGAGNSACILMVCGVGFSRLPKGHAMITEVLQDFELYDSNELVQDESAFEKRRNMLWRVFCEELVSKNSQLDRMWWGIHILGALLDDPRVPVDVMLEALGRPPGASC